MLILNRVPLPPVTKRGETGRTVSKRAIKSHRVVEGEVSSTRYSNRVRVPPATPAKPVTNLLPNNIYFFYLPFILFEVTAF